MNNAEFLSICELQFERCKKVLNRKRELYGSGSDRLEQFKRIASLRDSNKFLAVGDCMAKHVTLLFDLLEATRAGVIASMDQWNETVTDTMNYLLLLKALLEEDRDER